MTLLHNEIAEETILQYIAQKKDMTLLSTINQDWLHKEYQNLLNTFRIKTECLDYFYCRTFVEDNSIDVPLWLIDNVFKKEIKADSYEAVLLVLEERYLSRQINEVGNYIYDGISRKTHPLLIASGVQSRISKLTYAGEKIQKIGDKLDVIDTFDLIHTGIPKLDTLYLSKQNIMVLGGERGHQKTNFALHLLCQTLEHNVVKLGNESFKVMFFSREMSFKDLRARLIARLFRIPFGDVKTGKYNSVEINKTFHDSFWYYNDNFVLIKPEQINSVEDVAKFLLQEKSEIWAFDYMQLLARLLTKGDIHNEIAQLIIRFKVLAQVTNTLGVIVSTLNKPEKGRMSHVPRLEDLYSSVEIQYAATWIGLCYWSWFYNRSLLKEPFFVLWEKNRNEEPFTMPLRVIPEYSQFENFPLTGSFNATSYLE